MMMRDIEMPACEIVLKKCELSKGILIQKNKKTLNYTPLKTVLVRIHRARKKPFFHSVRKERPQKTTTISQSLYVKKSRKNIQFVFFLIITLS